MNHISIIYNMRRTHKNTPWYQDKPNNDPFHVLIASSQASLQVLVRVVNLEQCWFQCLEEPSCYSLWVELMQ